MKLIVKKVKGFFGNRKNGFIEPLFEINNLGDLRVIPKEEYPNNGKIFIADYELLETHIETVLFSIDNGFFINDDNNFPEKIEDSNASQKRINYNSGIGDYFSNLSPHLFIPIYTNKFNLDRHKLIEKEGIITNVFFLKDSSNNNIFGPFERDNYDLKATNYKSYDYEDSIGFRDFLDVYNEYDGSVIFKFIDKDIENKIATDADGIEYIIDFNNLFLENIGEIIEYTPITILHKWVSEKLQGKGIKFSAEIDDIENLLVSSIDKLKWKKYLNYIDQTTERDNTIEALINSLNEKGYIENSQKTNNQKEIDLIKETLKIKDTEIIKLKDERENLEIKLKEIKGRENDVVDKEKYPNLTLILHAPDQLAEIENIITNKKKFSTLKEDINRLEGQKDYLNQEVKKSEETERKVKESISLIKETWDKDLSYHSAKLADAKIYTDLLNGINISPKGNEDGNDLITEKKLDILPSEINSARSYIIETQKRLSNLNRNLSFNEVANLVITTNQSFLTIIAGAPGVGKTSLVTKLANTYGLNDEFGYLEINCARGWTSSKDLLGFYNPLTGKFQDAKTQLRQALKKSSKNLNAPYIILLDEANLSPLEHYWSDFIKLADNDYERKIKTYDKEEIRFGEGFKFIATINHDHTTEALSNRLIDRAAIVQIEKTNLLSDNIDINDDFVNGTFDFHDVQKLFPETSKWKSDEELIKKTLQQIKDKIESNSSGIILSPRKELAIKRYCKVATGILEGNSYTALDYAVAQHVLPLINGRGEQFEEILKGLKAEFIDKEMFKSEKLLNKILERGKDLKHFKYVYY